MACSGKWSGSLLGSRRRDDVKFSEVDGWIQIILKHVLDTVIVKHQEQPV